MKISSRISIIFSIITTLILVAFGITIYILESHHQSIDFKKRLNERIEITENFFLEKDSFSDDEYSKIRTQFSHTLSEETEEVLNLDKPNFKLPYSNLLQQQLLSNNTHSFVFNNLQGESKQFKLNNKSYLIIVTANDIAGKENLSFLLGSIILLILLAIPFIFTISFIITKRSLLPLSKKIEHANNITASNLHQRLKILNPNDEIGKLAIAFNKLLDRLEVSFDAQKSFITNSSHEIRNPLTSIIGEAEVAISKTRTPEEYQTSLSVILEGADSLSSTMNNLLQLSKINANEEGISYKPTDIGEFVISLKKSYDYLNPLNNLNLNIPNKKLIVNANQNLLKTAIINLFDNACKYSSNEEVIVRITQFENEVNINIIDKGIGIPEKDIDNIIEPFYRASNTFKFSGSGIGLALSSKIISLHNGSLSIISQEKKGTQVSIVLPLI